MTEEAKPPSHWWWLEREGSINQNRSTWLQSEISELNEKTKAMLELIEADADSFSQRAELYFEKRLELISLVEDLYRSHRTLAVRFDHLKSHTLSSPDDSNEEYPQVQPIQESNFNNKIQLQYSQDTESSDKEDDELLNLREEMKILRKETETQKEQMSYDDNENREVIRQLNLANQLHREEENDELMKLREEIVKLREENETQKAELMYKDIQNREAIKELNLAIQLFKEKEEKDKDEFMELKEEIEKLREENETQKEQLLLKDEENREVIKELTLANQFLKEEEENDGLKEEIEKLSEENETQKEQLMYKEKQSKEAIRELNLAIQWFKEEEEKENEELMKLREDVERVKEENEIQKEKLMQKDEEKMEVIRQLSMAMDLLREEKIAAIRGSSSRTKNRCGVDIQRQERLCSRLFG